MIDMGNEPTQEAQPKENEANPKKRKRSEEEDEERQVKKPKEEPVLKVKFVHPQAKLPTRAKPGDAGLDLYCVETVSLMPGEQVEVKTGIQVEIPPGMYGQVAPRSGLVAKHRIGCHFGTIDSGFRGEIIILQKNEDPNIYDKTKLFVMCPGMRSAQLLIPQYPMIKVVQVDELSVTERGENGFGSSGMEATNIPVAPAVALSKERNEAGVVLCQVGAKADSVDEIVEDKFIKHLYGQENADSAPEQGNVADTSAEPSCDSAPNETLCKKVDE